MDVESSKTLSGVNHQFEIILMKELIGLFTNLLNSIVHTNPSISMIVSSHQIIQHISTLLDQFHQFSMWFLVLVILFHMFHLQNDLLTHSCTLDSCTSMISHMSLILLGCRLYSKFQYLFRSWILHRKYSFYHFIWWRQLLFSEVILITIHKLLKYRWFVSE